MAFNIVIYDLFRVQVFSPEGIFLQEAQINSQWLFYCSGLVPGQEYNLVFTYNNALILCLSFTCNERGRVVFISPAHLLFNCALVIPRAEFVAAIRNLIKGGDEMEIVGLGFEKILIHKLMMSGQVDVNQYFRKYGFYMFSAGKDLQSKFNQNKKMN